MRIAERVGGQRLGVDGELVEATGPSVAPRRRKVGRRHQVVSPRSSTVSSRRTARIAAPAVTTTTAPIATSSAELRDPDRVPAAERLRDRQHVLANAERARAGEEARHHALPDDDVRQADDQRAGRDQRQRDEDRGVLEGADGRGHREADRQRRIVLADEPGHERGGCDEERHDHPGHEELDDHDPPPWHRPGEEVHDRPVVELGTDHRRPDDHRHEGKEHADGEVAEQGSRDVESLFGRRVAEEVEADDRDQQDPEQRQQHRAAPVEERAQGDRDERGGHRRTR